MKQHEKSFNIASLMTIDCKDDDLINLSRIIASFCETNVHIHNKYMLKFVDSTTKSITNGQKIVIYEFFYNLLTEIPSNESYSIISKFVRNNLFKQIITKAMCNIFDIKRQDDEKVQVIYCYLYRILIASKFQSDLYVYSPLVFDNGLENDDPIQEYYTNNKHLPLKNSISKQMEYFWRLYNEISVMQRKIISKFEHEFPYNYLSAFERSPFSGKPVALLFAGGIPAKSRNYYPEELNCLLLGHHLREMGYQIENIMCFVENFAFQTNKPPFENEQIHVFYDKVLCSLESFSINLQQNIFTEFLNHGNEEGFNFPFEPSKFSQSEFEEMCFVLNTFEKHVLFILDCFESSKIAECCSKNRHEFIHFITSSLPNGFSFYTMPFVNICANKSIGRKIHLSSMFFRYFVDAIYSINDCTSLREFVSLINHNGKNVGFEARLFSEDEELKVSLFLKSPAFKYFDYLHQVDNYQPDEIDSSDKQISKCYLTIIGCLSGYHNVEKIFKDIDQNIVDKEKKYECLKMLALEINEEIFEIEGSEPAKYLKGAQIKTIVDETLAKFPLDEKILRETSLLFGNSNGINYYDVLNWFMINYKVIDMTDGSENKLVFIYMCHPQQEDEIIQFIEKNASNYAKLNE